MVPLSIRLLALFTVCMNLPLSFFAFVAVPTGPALLCRTPAGSDGKSQPTARIRWGLGTQAAPWRTCVLQAATDESEQLRKSQQLTGDQREAVRSKQLNIACNDVVRTILDGNPSNEKERAEALRERLVAQRDDLVSTQDEMSALFFDNLLLVCQHELHPDIGLLRGKYEKAWNTILHYIEDAGWQLTDPPFSISG